MKLLLDQNLSWKLVAALEGIFPDTVHINSVLGVKAADRDVWLYAKENGFTIVSKDDDFEQLSILFGHPPKVIWLRIGNCTTDQVIKIL
jgi:predicted nuclease of predicted toxin-antitoxin system